MRVLVVEDEKRVAGFIRKALTDEGLGVSLCGDGHEALERMRVESFEAVVLDVMLPGRDGLSVLRVLRERLDATPVLILTARGSVTERVEGLNAGADDYLPKPFSMDELVARLRALIRRSGGETFSFFRVGNLIVRPAERVVERGGRAIALTAREFALLELLVRHPGRVFTRTQICERVWDYHFDPGTNVVDVYVQRLRRKVDDPFSAKLIHTVRGIGYKVAQDP
ncbi:MAG: response regulator transcription factor [Verrucomicrobia bacterium]|nr:response regulator transcription factor [Verrucomicrobiota bacterium]